VIGNLLTKKAFPAQEKLGTIRLLGMLEAPFREWDSYPTFAGAPERSQKILVTDVRNPVDHSAANEVTVT